MITLHTWKTPNGRKVSIMLEEVELSYRVVPVAAYPWTAAAVAMLAEPLAKTLGEVGHVKDWLARVGARPAVTRGMAVLQ